MHSFISVKKNSHFPIQNLPYGIFYTKNNKNPRVGTAIGEYILDLSILETKDFFVEILNSNERIFNTPTLNKFMGKGYEFWKEIRIKLQRLLHKDESKLRDNKELREKVFVLQKDATMLIPVDIGDYTDFYASEEHATNVGIMFRGKENALMPNWKHLPVGYHGRASSVVLSGTDIYRPKGQVILPNTKEPVFTNTNQLDFELEMGCIIGTGNQLGEPISIEDAEKNIFGLVLVNDWSARDIQAWEYQPLGPFLAKSFATSISPWIVSLEALEPFRIHGPKQDPEPLPYLSISKPSSYDIKLEVSLKTPKIERPIQLIKSNYKYLYWNLSQLIAHHTITGCNLNTGDLLASGTISGPTKVSRGSLLELAWQGTSPIDINSGEVRSWLADEDQIIMTGYCEGDNYRIGFGEVKGTILPSK